MKQLLPLIIAVSLFAVPAYAQDADADGTDDGMDLIEQGTQMIMRHLMEGMEEALSDLDEIAEEVGPAIAELQEMIGDLSAYHLPEVLPNGDIIIRRKVPLQVMPPGDEPGAEVDL